MFVDYESLENHMMRHSKKLADFTYNRRQLVTPDCALASESTTFTTLFLSVLLNHQDRMFFLGSCPDVGCKSDVKCIQSIDIGGSLRRCNEVIGMPLEEWIDGHFDYLNVIIKGKLIKSGTARDGFLERMKYSIKFALSTAHNYWVLIDEPGKDSDEYSGLVAIDNGWDGPWMLTEKSLHDFLMECWCDAGVLF